MLGQKVILPNTTIGHIFAETKPHLRKEEDGYYRTPLGGFGNHSDDPNCSKLLMEDGSWWITTNQEIMAGEEITWGYTLYEIY